MTSLVSVFSVHNDIGNIDPRIGFWGVADPSDVGNGKRTDDYGKVPVDDPQLKDVLAFIEERCDESTMVGYFTPTGVGLNQEISNLPVYAVYQHPSGRVMTVDAVDLARVPNNLVYYIIAFSGQEPDELLDQYPGLESRTQQQSGSPVNLEAPLPNMGPRFYAPSAADDPNRYVPVSVVNPTQEQLDRARYRNERQQIFQVYERVVGASWIIGGPPPKKIRVWQMVNG